jgi:hypothetical protein
VEKFGTSDKHLKDMREVDVETRLVLLQSPFSYSLYFSFLFLNLSVFIF